MNLKEIRSVYLVGIKGVAMTALALYCQDMEIGVTGSDTKELFVTDEILRRRKISWVEGFSEKNIREKIDLLVTTGAHEGLNNIEVKKAKELGIPVLTQAQALKFFADGKETISVCGVGGKTTTTSMLANLFSQSGLYPSYIIGVGEIFPLGFAGKYDSEGKVFICEADEFVSSPGSDPTPKFHYLEPKVAVVTNIEHDHPDVYPDLQAVKKSYLEFFAKIKNEGILVANIDNQNVRELIGKFSGKVVTYGFSDGADYQISDSRIVNGKQAFILKESGGKINSLSLSVFGDYNVMNAAAAFAVGKFYKIKESDLVSGLESFSGSKRRFEKVGLTRNGAVLYDDYAHHPKEISSVIKMTRQLYPKRKIIAVFQPHTYSRTKALLNDFAKSFSAADVVLLMDIYSSAREQKDPEVSSEILARKIKENGNSSVYYTEGHAETTRWLNENSQKGDIILTLGAGDIFYIHKDLVY